tara:strand:+ start:954 stop:1337 length:384 start_codon:yes stop_codon:yes gene_type:complete
MNTKPIWSFLLVDPNPVASRSVVGQLAYYGYTVHTEENGREALNYLHNHLRSTDLILLDNEIEDIPAKKIVLAFKKLNQNIPIILLTREKRAASPKQESPYGVIGQIKRPIRTDRLLSLIAQGLGLS